MNGLGEAWQIRDGEHLSPTTNGAAGDVNAREVPQKLCVGGLWGLAGLRKAEDLPARGEVVFFGPIGQEAEMADADEAGREGMKEEAAEKFIPG